MCIICRLFGAEIKNASQTNCKKRSANPNSRPCCCPGRQRRPTQQQHDRLALCEPQGESRKESTAPTPSTMVEPSKLTGLVVSLFLTSLVPASAHVPHGSPAARPSSDVGARQRQRGLLRPLPFLPLLASSRRKDTRVSTGRSVAVAAALRGGAKNPAAGGERSTTTAVARARKGKRRVGRGRSSEIEDDDSEGVQS